MKLDELLELLDDDLSWRKKEVSQLYALCVEKDVEVLRKSLLLVLYSHWEGFVKNAAKLYLHYVSKQKLKVGVLTVNFKTISMKGLINNCYKSSDSLTLNNELNFMDKFTQKDEAKFQIGSNIMDDKDKTLINTTDNLSPDVFSNFCRIIGVKYKDAVSTKKKYLDDSFLGNRNKISHGTKIEFNEDELEDFDLSQDSIQELKQVVLAILDHFKQDIEEYASQNFYLSENDEIRIEFDKFSEVKLDKTLHPEKYLKKLA
tara:strand:- start:1173 stop:1949 length:777 start_codon:yes stop_codon:yes gene_type:complete